MAIAVLERMEHAVEKVKDRLLRAVQALEHAGVSYAIIGGNAVAAWVATVDEIAVRNTQDVDILLNRADLEQAKAGLEAAGFHYRHTAGIDFFQDGIGSSARDAVHVIFANEKVMPDYPSPAPSAEEVEIMEPGLHVLALSALVRMKLTSYRRKDQVHLLDLIGVGLVGKKDLANLPPELAKRLKELLENPDA